MSLTIDQIETRVYAKRCCIEFLEVVLLVKPNRERVKLENQIARLQDEINELKVQKARIEWAAMTS